MNSKKIYQVFISSTYEDLREERNKVSQALLGVDCIPIGMENFNAADEDQFTVIKGLIASCDYFVLILGGKYGSIEENSQKSYTQLEYEYAKEQRIPTIAFYPNSIQSLTGNKIENDITKKEKLEEFTNMVKKQLCMSYTNADNLALNVIMSLSNLRISHPRCGWVRGDTISTNEANQKIIELQRENDRLKEEIASYKAEESADTSVYRHGDDKLDLIINPLFADAPFGIDLNPASIKISLTCDEIFKLIGYSFISPVPTHMADEIVGKIICTSMGYQQEYLLETQSSQAILSQFYAIGYLELRTGEVFQSGVMSYFVLSKYGMKYLVKLCAVKKDGK